MTNQRSFYYFDFIQFFLILILLSTSLIFVGSSTYLPKTPYSIFFKKQLFGIITGIIIYCLACVINYRSFVKISYGGYYILLALLTFTLMKGSIGMGAQRWIDCGLFKFQPSELAKIFFPPFLTSYLLNEETLSKKTILTVIGLLIFSFILIAKQPDLGTALILLFSGLIMLWICNALKTKFFITIGILFIFAIPFLWSILKSYQKQRIAVFLGYGDIHKEAYQREQALIAIGSGGFWGKGILQGSQNKLQFLPEGRTDFIFAVICEECGLIGGFFILILYSILFFRFYTVINLLTNTKIQFFAIGLIIHIVISMIINCGMVLGLLPIVGIPLPLLSYGITHLWISLISLGMFQNITMNRLYRND